MSIVDEGVVLWSAAQDERRDRPLLVLLHGHAMNEQIGFELRDRLPAELVIASVRGPVRVNGGYSWFPLDRSFSLARVEAGVQALLGWLDMQAGFSSIGLLGFSQGAAVAIQCMRTRPTFFGYVGTLSGFLNPLPAAGDRELARRRPPVFAGRGDVDPLVPRLLVNLTDRWLRGHTTLTSKVYAGLGHDVSECELSDLSAFLTERLAARSSS